MPAAVVVRLSTSVAVRTRTASNCAPQATVASQDRSVLLFISENEGLDSLELCWTTEHPPTAFPNPSELTVTAR